MKTCNRLERVQAVSALGLLMVGCALLLACAGDSHSTPPVMKGKPRWIVSDHASSQDLAFAAQMHEGAIDGISTRDAGPVSISAFTSQRFGPTTNLWLVLTITNRSVNRYLYDDPVFLMGFRICYHPNGRHRDIVVSGQYSPHTPMEEIREKFSRESSSRSISPSAFSMLAWEISPDGACSGADSGHFMIRWDRCWEYGSPYYYSSILSQACDWVQFDTVPDPKGATH